MLLNSTCQPWLRLLGRGGVHKGGKRRSKCARENFPKIVEKELKAGGGGTEGMGPLKNSG